ncbi:MAG: ribonuclease H-like domain-containing protein [Polyangiales bacterium]
MDVRAKLARLRTMDPPPGLFRASDAAAAAQAAAAQTPPAAISGDVIGAKSQRIAQLRALIGEVAARDKRRVAPEPELPASSAPGWPCVTTEHGMLYVHERWLEPEHHHGCRPVRGGLRGAQTTLHALLRDASLPAVDLSRALYLDTETTGLAGGTGTVAFLVGLARFDAESLGVEQLIVPQLGAEAPVLARLAERIAAASCIVTYNGKSFDWPLLRTRFVLARLPVPVLPPHIDLLHVCRSVWKARLPSLRLTDMEREILRFERQDDLPGAEIPARYFEFLRTGRAERLTAVLEHNQNDLIALAALLGAITDQFERVCEPSDPLDAVSFGRVALRAGQLERAGELAAWAQEHGAHHVDTDVLARALVFGSDVERQRGRLAESIALLERARVHQRVPLSRRRLHFRLAKRDEHELGDLTAALRHARNTEAVEGADLHGRRLGRLHRRLLRRAHLSSAPLRRRRSRVLSEGGAVES